jgi:hypothetical protein
MKGKPDVMAAQLDRFLRSGQAAQAEVDQLTEPVRITKTIRIDRALDLALKRAALDRTAASGARVTESDVIDQAIKQYLKL